MITDAFGSIGWGAASHLAALLVLGIQACAGARVLEWLGLSNGIRTHERILYGWAAGFQGTTLVAMVLTGFGVLGPVPVTLLFGGMAVIGLPVGREIARDCTRVLRTLDRQTRLLALLGSVGLLFWSWPLLVQTVLPNSDWDSALYHLPLADRYLAGSLWGSDMYFPAFAFPGAVHLLYAALMSLGLEAAISPLNYWIVFLLLVTTVALARRIGGRSAGVAAAALFCATPVLWQLGVDPRVDGFLCLTVLLAAYAVVVFVQEGRDVHLKLAAVALGAALGCKYTAIPFVGAILGVGLAFRLWGSAGSRGLSALLATLALGVAVPNAAWYAANVALHGDPLFPMLRGNYIATPDGGRARLGRGDTEEPAEHLRDPEIAARLASVEQIPIAESAGHLFDFVDLVRDPDRYAVKPHHGINPLLLLALAMPFAMAMRPERRRGALVVWGLGWGGFALLGSQTNLVRYVAPVLPLLAAAAGAMLARVPWRAARIAIGLVLVVLLARDFVAERNRVGLLRPAEALGRPSAWQDEAVRVRWLKAVGYNFTPPIAYATEQINAMLADGRMPGDSRILMVGEGKGRLIACETIPDSSWFAHRFVAELRNAALDHGRLAERLRDQAITHVLYNAAYYDWVLQDTATARSRVAFAQTHVERFLDAHGTLVYQGGGMRLVDIRRGAAK